MLLGRYRKLDWDYIRMAPIRYTGDPKLKGDDIRTIERNADVLLNACRVLV